MFKSIHVLIGTNKILKVAKAVSHLKCRLFNLCVFFQKGDLAESESNACFIFTHLELDMQVRVCMHGCVWLTGMCWVL